MRRWWQSIVVGARAFLRERGSARSLAVTEAGREPEVASPVPEPVVIPEPMVTVRRFSSRSSDLTVFLKDRLAAAVRYQRIAGYFRSSIFSAVGDAYASVDRIEVVCNSDLSTQDLRAVRDWVNGGEFGRKWREHPGATPQSDYTALVTALESGRLRVRVLPRDTIFLHGKAGLITRSDGSRTAFLGSVNETREGFTSNHELLWEDDSPDATAWVEEEFLALWNHPDAVDLPDWVVWDAVRNAARVDSSVGGLRSRFAGGDTGAAWELVVGFVLGTPLVVGGGFLSVWQRSFVRLCLRHLRVFGRVRLLLGDDVGLGKTLSLGVAGVSLGLLGGGRVLVLVPAGLVRQWQGELFRLLGVDAVRLEGREWVSAGGVRSSAGDLGGFPGGVAIVSTGLISSKEESSREWRELLAGSYDAVVLDEAHRARAGSRLRDFMVRLGSRTRHMLLGSGTPIQLDPREVWNLLGVLGSDAPHVLGDAASRWRDFMTSREFTPDFAPENLREAWDLIRNPLPPADEWVWTQRNAVNVFDGIRAELGMSTNAVAHASVDDLLHTQDDVRALVGDTTFFQRQNPLVRHLVFRRRAWLEDQGLLPRIGLVLHHDGHHLTRELGVPFTSDGFLIPPEPYVSAYDLMTRVIDETARTRGTWRLLRPLLQQRLCSSLNAARCTLARLLGEGEVALSDEDVGAVADTPFHEGTTTRLGDDLDAVTRTQVRAALTALERTLEAGDPKYTAVRNLLWGFTTDTRTFREHGCIVFSQYRDTAEWFFRRYVREYPNEVVGLYCGGGFVLLHDNVTRASSREEITSLVHDGRLRVLFATDAASEGLNLQKLGAMINVDLPWNPARLEQRSGRVRRLGQPRASVDVVHLSYAGTRDEDVMTRLSARLRATHRILGRLPDVITADWIDEVLELERDDRERLDPRALNAFHERYELPLLKDDAHEWLSSGVFLDARDVQGWLTGSRTR